MEQLQHNKETGDYQPIAAFISSKGNGLSPSFSSSFWVSHGLGIGFGRFDSFNFGCFSTTAAVNWVASKIPTRTSMAGCYHHQFLSFALLIGASTGSVEDSAYRSRQVS